MNTNIYQAALALRDKYAHVEGFETESCGDPYTDLYFIYHDSLHYYLGMPPDAEHEPVVLAAEMLLGEQDIILDVDIDTLTNLLGALPSERLEILISFYTRWFNR